MLTLGNTKLIEIALNAGQDEYSFGDQHLLKGRPIRSLVIFNSGVTDSGATVADPSDAYLFMKEYESNDTRQEIPAKVLTYAGAYPLLAFQEMDGRRYNWEESIVRFGSAPTTSEVFQMLVVYDQEQQL